MAFNNSTTRYGSVIGSPTVGLPNFGSPIQTPVRPTQLPPLKKPGDNLNRAINYYADYGGCGWWRMIAPEMLINLDQKGIINGLTTMVGDPNFYRTMKSVRLQRQATSAQMGFVNFLVGLKKTMNIRLIYEIDDIIFKEDIPDFNRCKEAFDNEEVRTSACKIMQMCDEITVTCNYMKEYYMHKTGNKNITVFPNYPARFWLDGHYDPARLMKSFEDNKKKPRILYAGSGTHVDIGNKNNQKDDFSHVADAIIRSREDFRWVFVGAFPLRCKPFIDRGEMEFISWFPLKHLWKAYIETNCQAVVAPLMDCNFNRAKSNIKYLEAATCGIPGVFQNLCTYEDAPLKFVKGGDMIDTLKMLLKDADTYSKYSIDSRKYADTMWLDDHLGEASEIYFTALGDNNRKELLRLNPEQAVIPSKFENSLLAPPVSMQCGVSAEEVKVPDSPSA